VELLAGHEPAGVFSVFNKDKYLPEKLTVINRYIDHLELLAGLTDAACYDSAVLVEPQL
jgi:hypothetical protein